jgi:hypothetical protein
MFYNPSIRRLREEAGASEKGIIESKEREIR